MFTLIKMISTRDLVQQQAPSLVAAYALATAFYKFGSFALECVAFLGTWFVIDGAVSFIRRLFRSDEG